MNTRLLDKSKKSNIKCEHCLFYLRKCKSTIQSKGRVAMARKYNEKYESLICENVPRKKLKSVEDRVVYLKEEKGEVDPWIGKKPHAKDGFVVQCCSEY